VAGFSKTIIMHGMIGHYSSGYCRGFKPHSLLIALAFQSKTSKNKNKGFINTCSNQILTIFQRQCHQKII
jgi:hypothetical protein